MYSIEIGEELSIATQKSCGFIKELKYICIGKFLNKVVVRCEESP